MTSVNAPFKRPGGDMKNGMEIHLCNFGFRYCDGNCSECTISYSDHTEEKHPLNDLEEPMKNGYQPTNSPKTITPEMFTAFAKER